MEHGAHATTPPRPPTPTSSTPAHAMDETQRRRPCRHAPLASLSRHPRSLRHNKNGGTLEEARFAPGDRWALSLAPAPRLNLIPSRPSRDFPPHNRMRRRRRRAMTLPLARARKRPSASRRHDGWRASRLAPTRTRRAREEPHRLKPHHRHAPPYLAPCPGARPSSRSTPRVLAPHMRLISVCATGARPSRDRARRSMLLRADRFAT